MPIIHLSWPLLGLLCLSGCAGATLSVAADRVTHPVSFSAGLPDRNGNVYVLGHGLVASGRLAFEAKRYSTFWSHYPRKTIDLSQEIDREIKRLGGEGVVQLSVTTRGCGINVLMPLTMLPVWPGCQSVRVEGVVVRRRPGAPPDLPAHRVYPLDPATEPAVPKSEV